MPSYCVTFHGSNFLAAGEGEAPIVGFYIIRYIRANTDAEAKSIALKSVYNEPKVKELIEVSVSAAPNKPKIEVGEINEISLFRYFFARNSGFIFYGNEREGT